MKKRKHLDLLDEVPPGTKWVQRETIRSFRNMRAADKPTTKKSIDEALQDYVADWAFAHFRYRAFLKRALGSELLKFVKHKMGGTLSEQDFKKITIAASNLLSFVFREGAKIERRMLKLPRG